MLGWIVSACLFRGDLVAPVFVSLCFVGQTFCGEMIWNCRSEELLWGTQSSVRSVGTGLLAIQGAFCGALCLGLTKGPQLLCFQTPPCLFYHKLALRKANIGPYWPVFTIPFFLFAPFAGHPSSSPFLGTFSPCSPPRIVLCSVAQTAQHRAWRGAVSGWSSPQSSGRKFLAEICVKKR